MNNSNRFKRGHGQDLIPTFGRSLDVAGMQEHKMHPIEDAPKKVGASPAPDARLGGRRAHLGLDGAPDIFEEKYQGRKGGRGQRTGA
jgi:hypothetical protein